jgi:hypothetical protein
MQEEHIVDSLVSWDMNEDDARFPVAPRLEVIIPPWVTVGYSGAAPSRRI